MQKSYLFIRKLIVLSVLAIIISCSSAHETLSTVDVKKTSEVNNATFHSLSYMLPRTVVKVEIETEKVIKKVGPYYRYSQRFLNLTNVIAEDSEEWNIKSVKIYTSGIADNSKQYSIICQGNVSANNISLSPDGVLYGINCFPQEPSQNEKPLNDNFNEISIDDVNFDNISLPEEVLIKTSTAAMAQEAANYIYRIRNNRFDILSNEIEHLPPDGEAYKIMLQELNKLEKDFVSLFAGITVSSKKIQTFDFIPDLVSPTEKVLCRFSKQNGIVDAMDLSGTPIYIKLNVLPQKKLTTSTEIDKKNPPINGLYYCLPAKGIVSIIDKNKEVAQKEVKICQLGQVVSMPPSILTKEGVTIELCPSTGALIRIFDK